MNRCEICRELIFFGKHYCNTLFEVLDYDYTGDDWADAYLVYATDHESAAEKGCEEMDDSCGEGPHARTIYVRRKGETEVRKFSVEFEYSVDYSAYAADGNEKD